MTKHEAILGRQEVAALMTELVFNDELAAANDLVGLVVKPLVSGHPTDVAYKNRPLLIVFHVRTHPCCPRY
jgi:hypothetical protein